MDSASVAHVGIITNDVTAGWARRSGGQVAKVCVQVMWVGVDRW